MTPFWQLCCHFQVRICREVGHPRKKTTVGPGYWWAHQNGIKRGKKSMKCVDTSHTSWLISLFLWSFVQPPSMRRGRWSEQPSERSEMSSSKASAAVWWSHGLLSRRTKHLFTDLINMWQELFVKYIFLSRFSGILNADSEQEAVSIWVAIITQLSTENPFVIHALEIWDKIKPCGRKFWVNHNQFWNDYVILWPDLAALPGLTLCSANEVKSLS